MSRLNSDKLRDMIAFDYITEAQVLECCLTWMDEQDITEMCNTIPELAELFDDEESGLNFIYQDDDEIYLDIVVGDKVYWNDPSDDDSGEYIVVSINTDGGRVLSRDDIITIGNNLEDIQVSAKQLDK